MAYKNATLDVTLKSFTDDDGVRYPALGRQSIPYSAAPQLVASGQSSRIVAPHDFIWNDGRDALDFSGHGTHVSGTIGQLTNDGIGTAGVAFNVRLMPVKVLASEWDVIFGGSPDEGGTDDQIARGIRYAADNGAKILNMSLGGSGPPNCAALPNNPDCSPVIEAALRYAVGKGCFVVVAGGNEFEDTVPFYGKNPTSVIAEIASRIKGVVSVAAVDPGEGPRATTRAPAATSSWRRRADRSAASRTPATSASRHSTSTGPTRFCCRPRSIGRRASTSSATSATSARRWPRRTSPASPRCSCSRA